ncbi:hypothetical protein FXW78_14765 [Rhodococcus opacus]|nr:hypothetical protein [Rhodococcus opacus]RZK95651.1 MAG: hypothetical protein EOP30_03310 [Rhodococcus sp. (in: high G+C Gram-positive bacteria)]
MGVREQYYSTIGIARRVFDSCIALVATAAVAPVAFALAEGIAMSRIAGSGLEPEEFPSDEKLHDLGTMVELI